MVFLSFLFFLFSSLDKQSIQLMYSAIFYFTIFSVLKTGKAVLCITRVTERYLEREREKEIEVRKAATVV